MFRAQPTMVSRDRELAELVAAVREASGGARLLMLRGIEGMGRTTIVRALAHHEEQAGSLVLWATATRAERNLTHAVYQQLVAGLAAPGGERRVGPVFPAATSVPALAAALAHRISEHMTGARTALVVVDDAENCDEASLSALSALVRHHSQLAVAAILVGPADFDPGLDAQWSATLKGLDSSAVGQVAALIGRPLSTAVAHTLQRHTEGNPRDVLALLEELPASTWQEPVLRLPAPPAVRARVHAAMNALDEGAREALAAVAVLGDQASLAAIGMLTDVEDAPGLLNLADRLWASGLVVRTMGPGLALPGSRIAAAVLAELPQARVARLHAVAAQNSLDEGEQVRHLALASPVPDESLARRLECVARQCETQGRWARAAELWDLAVAQSADPLLREDRHSCALEALVAAGQIHTASARVTLVAQQRETALRDAVQGYLALNRGRRDQASRHLERAHDIVSERNPEEAALIASHCELHALCDLRGGDLLTWADRTVALAGAGSTAGIEAQAIRGLGLALTGDWAGARAYYTRAREVGGHSAQGQRFAMARGWLALADDDLETARVELEDGAALTRGGSLRIALWSQAWLARVCLLTGEWEECTTILEQALAASDESGISLVTPLLQWTVAELAAARGQWERAETAIRAAQRHTHGYRICRGATQLAAATLAHHRSQHEQVIRLLEPLREMGESTFLPWRHLYATSLVQTGRLSAATAFLDECDHAGPLSRVDAAQARLAIARGRLYGTLGQLDLAREAFAAGTAHLDGAGMVHEAAHARFATGQTLRRAGRRREADEVLELARQTFLTLGAATMVARCDRELSAGGLHEPGRSVRSDVDLTPQEQAVASLVAQGLSNRSVASQLFLSPKTVQYHLTRVYSKLGLRSRTELAVAWSVTPTGLE